MSSYVAAELRQLIRAHFHGSCAYCQTPEQLTIAVFEIEHIIPRSNGGPTVFENLCLACPTCNRYKGTRQSVLEPDTGQLVALFHPHRQDWDEHFEWSLDASTLLGLTDIGQVTIHALRMNRPQLIRLRRMWTHMDEFPPRFGALR